MRLEALSRTESKAKLVKWPVDRAVEIAELAKQVDWPQSARSYVEGKGACVGLMSGSKGTRVFSFSQIKGIVEITRRVNSALSCWAD